MVDDREVEPDYRFTLANERTFLAWLRTALGLLAAAVAVVQLVPELVIPGARHLVGAALAAMATLTAVAGLVRWQQVETAIRRGQPLPKHRTPIFLGVGLGVLGVVALGLIVASAVVSS
ncbi:MAG: YidH family protein [Mycobacterium sp.]